ncbi:MAG: hypothetical protein HQK75_04720 [Candidatus Magnetomorum sp.]|nr:hypothetical protein [Candidatus Magnetomorum sp.]
MLASTNNIPKELLSQLSDQVCKKLGLEFPENRHKDLMRGIEGVSKVFGFDKPIQCIEWLIHSELNKETLDTLVCHLTIGETYFFRDSGVFTFLKEKVLHELIYSRWHSERYVRIWSAACCTGEEPYSIAMLIDQILPNRNQWNISIIATDINEQFLNKAKKGLYTRWSFRNTPEEIQQKYFVKTENNQFKIHPEIKKMVTFFPLNLAESGYPSLSMNINEMDLICCRNVLMYFSETVRNKVVHRLSNCLAQKGWLLVSPGEADHARKTGLKPVRSSETTLFQKLSQKIPPADSSYFNAQPVAPSFHFTSKQDEEYKHAAQKPVPSLNVKESHDSKESTNVNRTSWTYEDALKSFEQGTYDHSILILSGLLEAETNNPKYMALIARCYSNLKQNDIACSWCEKATLADAFNSSYYFLLASIQQEKGSIDQAIKSLNQALYLEPSLIMAYMALGMIRRKQGRQQDSQKCIKNALYYLKNTDKNDIVPLSDGMTAGRLTAMLESMSTD